MTAKVFQIGGTDITWLSSTGSEVLTLTSLGAGAGRQGAQHDFGDITTAREMLFDWHAFVQFGATPVLDETVDIYWKGFAAQSSTRGMNDDGTGDAALSAEDKLKNLIYLGSIIVDEAAVDIEMTAFNKGDPIWIPHRYGMPVFFNNTADVLTATALEHGFTLTPITPQAQAT